jgi:hypothetical protein
MKNIRLYTLFVLFFTSSFVSLGQDIQHNLEKYWYYRQRLKDKFMVVSANNEQGTNIPMARIENILYNKRTWIYWGDGNGETQYYLGVLATEYRLLKDYGQDYTETRNELVYALRALERIDLNAEKEWRDPKTSQTGDLNGFFIRDDVDSSFAQRWASPVNNWAGKGLASNYSRIDSAYNYTNEKPFEMSQDNVWNYLLNLALVKKLVDDETKYTDASGAQVTIQEWTKKITYRMVDRLHFVDWTWGMWHLDWSTFPPHFVRDTIWFGHWQIRNPVTNQPVELGAEPFLLQSIFAEAGNWITDKEFGDMNFNLSAGLLDGEICYCTEYIAMNTCLLFNFNDYSMRALMTVMGEDYLKQYWAAVGRNESLYLRLCQLRDAYFLNNNFIFYEHMPLIFLVLHGGYPNETNKTEVNDLYENVLNQAPDCGPYNYGAGHNLTDFSFFWSATNRLVWPESCASYSSPINFLGDYNGLDYMLLHNLYWLVYQDKIQSNIYWTKNFAVSPNGWGSSTTPAIVIAQNNLYATNKIDHNGVGKFIAGNEVDLLPGFETELGAEFEAYATESIASYKYMKLEYTPDCSNHVAAIKSDSNFIVQNVSKEKSLTENKDIFGSEIKIYPNPNNGKFSIMVPQNQSTATMSVSDMLGNVILSKQFTGQFAEADISAFAGGVYLLKINAEGRVYTQKIVYGK